MKRNLLLLLLFAVPFVSFAGKRLTVLTHTSQYTNERGVFTYDDQGRISRVDITDGQNNTSVATYTYDESRIVCNSDADNKVLEAVCDLEDGRVKMMSIYLSSENLVARENGGSSHVYTLEWEETAGIDAVTSDSRRSGYYTLDGRRLQDAPSRSGVFLHDGKKYVVR